MEKSSQKASFGQGLELANIIIKAITNAAKKTGASSEKVQEVIGKPGVIFKYFESLLSDGTKILELISSGEKIPASDGKSFISKAEDTFKGGINSDFTSWGLDKTSDATPEIPTYTYKVVSDATFARMFFYLDYDLNKLAVNQSQIILFCIKHSAKLYQSGCHTFFLTKVDDDFFVVRVCVSIIGGLHADVYRFENDYVCDARYCYNVIVPQIKS